MAKLEDGFSVNFCEDEENTILYFATFNQEYNDVIKVTSNSITSASPQQRTSKEVGSKRMLCLKVIDTKHYKGNVQ